MPKRVANSLQQTDYSKIKSVTCSRWSINKTGFTLIELLVVISIIAVLASAVLYSTDNARQRGRDGQRKENLKTINSALISYHVDNKTYPPETSTQRDFASDSSDPNGWIPNLTEYIDKLPKDPVQTTSGTVAAVVSSYSCEAEDFATTGLYEITDPGSAHPASGNFGTYGGAIWTNNSGNASPPLGDYASATKTLFLQNTETATYYFWVRVRYVQPGIANNDSFYVKIDNGPEIIVGNETDPGGAAYPDENFHWINFANNDPDSKITFTLAPGEHSIVIRSKEDGHKIDKIELSSDPAYTPLDDLSSVPKKFGAPDNCPATGTLPDPNVDPPTPDTGACDNKQGILCLRVSPDKNAYVLWTELENINDREHFTKSESPCNQNTLDSSNTSSPYYGLGRPTGGFLNYCIMSPR